MPNTMQQTCLYTQEKGDAVAVPTPCATPVFVIVCNAIATLNDP